MSLAASTDVDAAPTSAESRVMNVKMVKVITVYGEEINKTGTMSVEMGMQLSLKHRKTPCYKMMWLVSFQNGLKKVMLMAT